MKTFWLTVEDCEVVKAVYDKSLCANRLVIMPRLLSEIVASTFLDKKLQEVCNGICTALNCGGYYEHKHPTI